MDSIYSPHGQGTSEKTHFTRLGALHALWELSMRKPRSGLGDCVTIANPANAAQSLPTPALALTMAGTHVA